MDTFERAAALAEFKALRDESVRCAQLLSNATWVAVTGYTVTIGAAAAFLGRFGSSGITVREDMLLPATLALLCLEAMAISAMYLSELWKYVRVGAYIREELALPTRWERWIQNHRAYELYIGSLTFLQLPVLITAFAMLLSVVARYVKSSAEPGSLVEWLTWLTRDLWMTALLTTVIIADGVAVMWLVWRVALAARGEFGWPRFSFRPKMMSHKDQSASTREAVR